MEECITGGWDEVSMVMVDGGLLLFDVDGFCEFAFAEVFEVALTNKKKLLWIKFVLYCKFPAFL